MRSFYDCEFIDDGRTVDLISVGVVDEDGREYYAVASDAPWDRIRENDWLMGNVWPHLPLRGHKSGLVYTGQGESKHEVKLTEPGVLDTRDVRVKPRWVIANEVREFLLAGGPDVELWADYAAYDHVVLCQLWGRMIDLPKGVPMWTHDLRQLVEQAGHPDLPEQAEGLHNALADAKHVRAVHRLLTSSAETL